jgi:hypothetical protein
MNGVHHRVVAASLWPAWATLGHAPHWQVIAGIPVAVAFSAGWTSPDVDDTWLMEKATKWIPGRWDHEIFGHRQTLHWWGWPALLAYLAGNADLGVVGWAVWAALLGWTSHIVADAAFGRGGRGVPAGIPLLPWGAHVGLGFKSDGAAAHVLTWPICLILAWIAVGHPGTAQAVTWAAGG